MFRRRSSWSPAHASWRVRHLDRLAACIALLLGLTGPLTDRAEAGSAPASGSVLLTVMTSPQAPMMTLAQLAPVAEAARLQPASGDLDPFYARLLKLEAGTATKPLTILHLGDSHIAADRITSEIRRLFQARFGDGGRGLMMPGFPFPYYKAPGFSFDKTGTWEVANSLTDDGDYGITGVSLTAREPDAMLGLSATDAPFTSVEVWLLTGPGHGRAVLSAGERREEVATSADEASVLRVKLPVKASSLRIEAVGDGPVTVLGWSVDNGKAHGIRYVNLGIPSASAFTTRRFDRKLAASDIAALAPGLVILGYGTNEGFNDDLDVAAYEREYERLIKLVKAAAPDASLVILAPFDGNRLPRYVAGEDRASAPCHPLSEEEQASYAERLANEDPALARWHTPPKLATLRALLASIAARHGAAYLDLSEVMGGPCGMHRWVMNDPPLGLPDHAHLSDEGSRRMGKAIYQALMSGYAQYRKQAAAAGASTGVAKREGL